MNETVTLYLSIGNSDDKLAQSEWSLFVAEFRTAVCSYADEVYGIWYSAQDDMYQNACIASSVAKVFLEDLRKDLTAVRERYRQDAIAWAVAPETEFI